MSDNHNWPITPMTSLSCFFLAERGRNKFTIQHKGPTNWYTLPLKGVPSDGITYLSFTIGSLAAGHLFLSALIVNNQKDFFKEALEKKTTYAVQYPGQANTNLNHCESLYMSNGNIYHMGSYLPPSTLPPTWQQMIGKKVGLLIDYPRDQVMIYYVNPSDNSVIWKYTLITGIQDFEVVPLLALYNMNDYVALDFDDKKPTEIEDLEKEFEFMRHQNKNKPLWTSHG